MPLFDNMALCLTGQSISADYRSLNSGLLIMGLVLILVRIYFRPARLVFQAFLRI